MFISDLIKIAKALFVASLVITRIILRDVYVFIQLRCGRKFDLSSISPFQIGRFKEILEEYSHQPVDFVVVYIKEAHAVDEWASIHNRYKITQPTTLPERLSAATTFTQDTQVSCPVLVDNMQNEASIAYGAMPERLYVIYNGMVTYEGGQTPFQYKLEEMKKNVDDLLAKKSKTT